MVSAVNFHALVNRMSRWRGPVAGAASVGVGALLLSVMPQLRIELFAAAAARVAASMLGVTVEHQDSASLISLTDRIVAVTAGCSGTDFFLMVAGLLGWRLARDDRAILRTIVTSLIAALPVTLLVNALRVVAVTQAHRWVIPHLPERHSAFAHMATGTAVFLPSLIALNLVLEFHAKRRRPIVR